MTLFGVTRAKSGGRQSVKDATGKYAKSMGASLRRHNEVRYLCSQQCDSNMNAQAALERDIVEILTSWKSDLDSCDLIFTSVSASDHKAVFGGTAPPLNTADARVRKIPFATRRPTFSETKRISHLLTSTYKASCQIEAPQPKDGIQQEQCTESIRDPAESQPKHVEEERSVKVEEVSETIHKPSKKVYQRDR